MYDCNNSAFDVYCFQCTQCITSKLLWLIDPYGPAGTEFYHLQGNRFVPFMYDADDILHSAAVPGFWINVQWLWPGDEPFIPVHKALAQILDA